MSYFSTLPEVYVGTNTQVGYSQNYVKTANIFRRSQLKDEFQKYVTAFEPYFIQDFDRPDVVSRKLYGTDQLDWIILLTNNITNLYNDWPKDRDSLQRYVQETYESGTQIHHYETIELRLPSSSGFTGKYGENTGPILVKGGIVVNASYRHKLPDGTLLPQSSSLIPVTNYEYEEFENEKKRFIYVLQPYLVDRFLDEHRDIMKYVAHKEIDDYGAKRTPNTVLSRSMKVYSGVSIFPRFGDYGNDVAATKRIEAFLEKQQFTESDQRLVLSGQYTSVPVRGEVIGAK